jgi:hypothetical protein
LGATPLANRLPAALCNEIGVGSAREIVFERVTPGELDEEDIRQLAAGNREVVVFRWSESTGELSYDTTAPSTIFSDLAVSPPAAGTSRANCGSR